MLEPERDPPPLSKLELPNRLGRRLGGLGFAEVLEEPSLPLLLLPLLLALLFAHTGSSLGEAFNRWFLLAVLATIASGALLGIFTVLENRRPHVFCHRQKYRLHWLHVGLAWPIAALLVIHILTVYYY